MKWLALLALIGGCLFAPDPPYGFQYEWTPVSSGTGPGPMHGAKLTFDQKRGTFVMYAGHNHLFGALSGKVWEWRDSQWREICAGGDVPAGTRPEPVALPGFTWDGNNEQLVLVGGARNIGAQLSFDNLSDEVWTCDDQTDTWTLRGSIQRARAGASLVHLARSGELALIGGRDASEHILNIELARTADLSFATDATMKFPSAGGGQTATYDSNTDHIVVLASELTLDNTITPHDELWSYDGVMWTELCEGCSGTGRSDASVVHVEGSPETYVIGGYVGEDAGGTARNVGGTWIYDTGRLLQVDTDPPERNAIGVASSRGQAANTLLMYGGTDANCSSYECSEGFEYGP